MKRTVCIALLSLLVVESRAQDTLKDAFDGRFRVGVAVSRYILQANDQPAMALMAREFNAGTPENALKWERVHPKPGRYDFRPADRVLRFAEQHGLSLTGHTLCWHRQTPAWVFEHADGRPLSRDELLARMEDHIATVVRRYRGRIDGWDVVNEAVNEDGTLRDSPWRRIIGDDYLEHAFRFAEAADPQARLYYNDYNLCSIDKAAGAVRLAGQLKAAGCRIDGIGMQGHWNLWGPSLAEIERSIKSFAAVVDTVAISELDINVLPWPGESVDADVARRAIASPEFDPYTKGLPADKQAELAERYAAIFRLLLKHDDVIDRVTFWGLDDGRSWHNKWPIAGRTAHSLLFDRSLNRKPAYDAVIATAANH